MNKFNKLKITLLLLPFITTYACTNTSKNSINDNKFEIENLRLFHKRSDGSKYMFIDSTRAKYGHNSAKIVTDNPTAIIYKKEMPYYFISSSKGFINENGKFIILDGNVTIRNKHKKFSKITGTMLRWNTEKDILIIDNYYNFNAFPLPSEINDDNYNYHTSIINDIIFKTRSKKLDWDFTKGHTVEFSSPGSQVLTTLTF